jgi:YgiT-type zinc finger domain-containing protein
MLKKNHICAECGGSLKKKIITHTQPWGEELYRFEDVPAWVCTQCGHIWLEAETSQLIDEIIAKQPTPHKYQKVPVFSLEQARPKVKT